MRRSRISHHDLFAIIALPAAITLIIMPCFWASRSPAARERLAWYTYDWSNSAFVSSALTMFAPILYSNLFGPSFFSYYISMSVIAQCLVFISVSAFADYGSGRKMFFIGFSVIGCICTSLMATISSPSDKSSAAALLILANVCYGASFVFYNSYIPFLAASHEDVAAANDNQKSVIHLSSQLQTCIYRLLTLFSADCAPSCRISYFAPRLCGWIRRRHPHDAYRSCRRVSQRSRPNCNEARARRG